MHVSPAKHSYAWLLRKCDYRTDTRTDGRTDRQMPDKVIPMFRYASQATQKSRCVGETLRYAPGGNKVQKAIFSFKVKVKVTRSLTLVWFERASLVEYECQICSFYLLRLTTDRQINRRTDRQEKKNMPPIIRFGGKKNHFKCCQQSLWLFVL